MKIVLKQILLICVLATAMAAQAIVKLPSILSDGVVLQRDCPVKIWGWADPGEKVHVSIAGHKSSAVTAADSTWSVMLNPVKAGGPFTLKVNDLCVNDVLFGDIYLCSGQSNMELPVNRVMDFFRDEVNSYNNDLIREFKTPKEYAFNGPRSDVKPSKWKKARPGEAERFGALVYFMAKELYERNGHVPVGIVNSSWGGSKIETWLSESAVENYPEMSVRLRLVQDNLYRELVEKAENRASDLWYKTMIETDPGYRGTHWASPGYDDGGWQKVELLGHEWGKVGGKSANGSHWLRRAFNVDSLHAGKPAELRLGCIVDADSVWVNGTFVGFTAYQYPPRIYQVPDGVLHEGDNIVTVRVVSNIGTPHFVPEKPHKFIFADGNEISLEGEWKHSLGALMPQVPAHTDFFQNPSTLYNGLIAPMASLPFRGVVWYQGESDVDIRNQYCELMKALIADWRDTFANPGLPFYIVELADFLHPSDTGGRSAWQEMRDAQRRAAEETDRAYWIKNGDIGEWNDIHPRDKKTPGKRTAQAILATP